MGRANKKGAEVRKGVHDDRCSGVCLISRLSQSYASQVLSVSRCKKEVCNMHAHAARLLCKMPLLSILLLAVIANEIGHSHRLTQEAVIMHKEICHPPRTEVAPSLSPNTLY